MVLTSLLDKYLGFRRLGLNGNGHGVLASRESTWILLCIQISRKMEQDILMLYEGPLYLLTTQCEFDFITQTEHLVIVIFSFVLSRQKIKARPTLDTQVYYSLTNTITGPRLQMCTISIVHLLFIFIPPGKANYSSRPSD